MKLLKKQLFKDLWYFTQGMLIAAFFITFVVIPLGCATIYAIGRVIYWLSLLV